jgi:hypothetical protein
MLQVCGSRQGRKGEKDKIKYIQIQFKVKCGGEFFVKCKLEKERWLSLKT